MTTAARVFALAMAFGLAASDGKLSTVGTTLALLCVVATFMSAVDVDPRIGFVVPAAEAVVVSVILILGVSYVEPMLVYLIVPALVAALRHGAVSSLIVVLAELLAAVSVAYVGPTALTASEALPKVLPWLILGAGVGQLAAWMRSAHRTLEQSQAPYESAHRLLTQLRSVYRALPTGLNTGSIAEDLTRRMEEAVPTASNVVLLIKTSSNALLPLRQSTPATSDDGLTEDQAVLECWLSETPQQVRVNDAETRTCLPLRVGSRMVGLIVAEVDQPLSRPAIAALQPLLDEQSLRLETALLFDEVRALATREERTRLAREIHDGIAQDLASLGYMIDDLTASADTQATRSAAVALRSELTRLVGELRLSIFDLRHEVEDSAGLGAAIAEYAREVGTRAGLSVHSNLQESHGSLRPNVEAELLRIAQEAITNARKHSRAANLWVSLDSTADPIRIQIEDDGIGTATMRSDHYGLRIMHERARSIDAAITIGDRPNGGTVVEVLVPTRSTPIEGVAHVDNRADRRRPSTHPRRSASRVRAQR